MLSADPSRRARLSRSCGIAAHPAARMPRMATVERSDGGATHEVFNQAPPLEGYNVFEADTVLTEAVAREGAEWAHGRLRELGAIAGRPDVIELGRLANENPPRLRTHDRFGNRIDEVEFHPAWHELMRIGVAHGIHAAPWQEPGAGAHIARAAAAMLLTQAEAGVMCPISMTYSAIPALRTQPELAQEWEPRFGSLSYDERLVPAHRQEGRALRDGHDREAGRLGRPREHDHRPPAERRRAWRRV